MKKYEILVFATGAVTLALELLASRIMTPYFGVSLYIWSGILSITLTFLAIGYWWGGRLCSTMSSDAIEFLILATPVASAAAMGLAAVVYPIAFPVLSQINLILGSFVGATLLLALPLIALSALNPLLIGLQRAESTAGDSGAGRIFFISTIGSVGGVLVTAFLFIPNITNFRAVLMLSIGLCVAALALVNLAGNVDESHKRRLFLAGLVIAVACGALSTAKKDYLALVNKTSSHQETFVVLAEYTSMFGNIKVAEVKQRDGTGVTGRVFIQDGLVQNRTDLENISYTSYTYVLEALAHSFEPRARDALVLGLGAGIVPQSFERSGLNVSVVEINPSALRAASEYFGFDPRGIDVHLEDARTYVRRCDRAFDVAIVDLFLGDNIPDYLPTREFFGDLRRCVRENGSVVMNAFFDVHNVENNKRLLATVGDAFSNLYLAGAPENNVFIIGTTGGPPEMLSIPETGIPDGILDEVTNALRQFRVVSPQDYSGSLPISDDHNVFSVIFSDANMLERQHLVRSVPADLLVN